MMMVMKLIDIRDISLATFSSKVVYIFNAPSLYWFQIVPFYMKILGLFQRNPLKPSGIKTLTFIISHRCLRYFVTTLYLATLQGA